MPFFKFSHFTGRLTENNRLLPLNPIKPVPLDTAEVPPIRFDTVKTQAAKSAAPSSAGGSSVANNPDYARLNPKNHAFMKKLQADLEAPVYLAKGTPDKILFGITVAIVVIASFESFRFLWRKANP
ncbi:cytochrome c oxidase subunit 7A-related protein, mitochondrial-like [Leptopilina heterotoma]|uniref:cytochrome c oxidase subunit 7A-related protein, mitochondrial-like n=1 Tax=Leptopilina heterotoma TaxID=63436 RepID=UPI001CAA20E6|nr:cytochrome c oxidase subunit 7A-related protein, mitochondrial-like [Leptopilina heterotoma]